MLCILQRLSPTFLCHGPPGGMTNGHGLLDENSFFFVITNSLLEKVLKSIL